MPFLNSQMAFPFYSPSEVHAVLKLGKNKKINIGSGGLKTADFICTSIRGTTLQFSRNTTNIFLELLHLTVVIVFKGLSKMSVHRLERFWDYWSLIAPIDFVVIEVVLTGSTYLARQFI